MHKSAEKLMRSLLAKYCPPSTTRRVLEPGAYLYGSDYPDGFPVGGYRSDIIKTGQSKLQIGVYTGLDLMPGPNVDVVASDPFHWPIEDASYDLVISGQCMEHVTDLRAWMDEGFRVLVPGGLCIHIAPSGGPYHAFPIHCWLIMKDGMEWLLKESGFEILEVNQHDVYPFNDCWGVGRKPS